MNPAKPAASLSGVAAGVAAGLAGGLVPSKTSLRLISFAPSVVAENRVKRLKKSVWASGHLHGLTESPRGSQPWFVTLTYKGVHDWLPDHISKSIHAYRMWCASFKIPCRYTWVAELQSRGAVHYHMLCWLPKGLKMPQWDRPYRLAFGKLKPAFWGHGMTNTQIALSGVGYLMKYLSKLGELTKFPKGLRLYGIGGLTQQGRSVRSWFNLPEWVKRSHGVDEIIRLPRGFLVRATGEILEPAFQVLRVPFGIVLRALRELPARFHDGCYSTFPRAI